MNIAKRHAGRHKRHRRIRRKMSGTAMRPRVCVFRSDKHIYAQVVDDETGTTLISASSQETDAASKRGDKSGKIGMAWAVGQLLAERAQAKGVAEVCFDRGGFLYHGRIKALAEGAREGGLRF